MIDFSFRQFQEELRKLEEASPQKSAEKPLGKKELANQKREKAKSEFLALREKYQWTVGDVIAFFPEEEGIGYLMELLEQPAKKRRRKL